MNALALQAPGARRTIAARTDRMHEPGRDKACGLSQKSAAHA
jgi:hypothetical protein